MEILRKGVTGSTLRGGVVDKMVYNNTCPIIYTSSLGGWDWKGK